MSTKDKEQFVKVVLGHLAEEHERDASDFEVLALRVSDAFETEGQITQEELNIIMHETEISDGLKMRYPKLYSISLDSYGVEFEENEDEDEDEDEEDSEDEDEDVESEDSDEELTEQGDK